MKLDSGIFLEATELPEAAAAIEAIGFDGVYTLEGPNDPFVSAAVAAMSTKDVTIMTSIAVAFARNPMNLAYLGNDLQNLSKGRFILGLGTQVKSHVEHRFSMPWGKPVTRMRDMVLAIRAIWNSWQTGERLHYEGEYYHHTLMVPTFMPKPNPYGSPKIYLAGVGPKMTQMVGEIADGYFVHPFGSKKSLDELTMPSLQAGFEKAGRDGKDFNIAAQIMTATGLDSQQMDEAIASARNQIAFYGSTPAYLPVLDVHGWGDMHLEWKQMVRENRWADMAASVNDDMLHAFATVGTPKEVAKQIVDRSEGRLDRVSPVVYKSDTKILAALAEAIAAEV